MNWQRMSVSSVDKTDTLDKVNTKQIRQLLSVVLQAHLRRVQFIEQIYTDGAQNFRETLQFLVDLGWISERAGELHLAPSASTAGTWLQSDEDMRQAILAALIGLSSPYRLAVATYIRKFKVAGTELRRRPSLSERTLQRPLRDLLMDLRIVSYRASDETYILQDSAVPLYVWATNFVRPSSRHTYEALQRGREELGYAAELVVIDFERKRLGAQLAHRVEHVSAAQPFACYDIKSATVTEGQAVDRYIEVKAVSDGTFQFYWSKSEVDVAKVLRDNYYLYLLPYAVGRGFDIEALIMMPDPHRVLSTDSKTWEIEEDVLVCRRKPVSAG